MLNQCLFWYFIHTTVFSQGKKNNMVKKKNTQFRRVLQRRAHDVEVFMT